MAICQSAILLLAVVSIFALILMRNKAMTDRLKPTNEEIVKYIIGWIAGAAQADILTVHDWKELEFFLSCPVHEFETLRSLFEPKMYDSIKDYVNNERS